MFTHISKEAIKKAIRISLKPTIFSQDEKHFTLFEKMRMDTASPEDAKEFRDLNELKNQRILEMPDEKLFWVSDVEIKLPEKAIIYSTLICSKCGEGVMEPLGRVKNEKKYVYLALKQKMSEDLERTTC